MGDERNTKRKKRDKTGANRDKKETKGHKDGADRRGKDMKETLWTQKETRIGRKGTEWRKKFVSHEGNKPDAYVGQGLHACKNNSNTHRKQFGYKRNRQGDHNRRTPQAGCKQEIESKRKKRNRDYKTKKDKTATILTNQRQRKAIQDDEGRKRNNVH